LQSSPGAIDCGDLSSRATTEEQTKAVECAREAFNSAKPFHVFWQTADADGPGSYGVVARLEDDRLHVFSVWTYDAKSTDRPLDGAAVTWAPVSFSIAPSCSTSPDDCLGANPSSRVYCSCYPAGDRGSAPDGVKVELRCKRQ
jgi:hypothetical protein